MSPLLNLQQEFVFIKMPFFRILASGLQLHILVATPLLLDSPIDERILELFPFGEGTDVGLLVVGLTVHQHVIVLISNLPTFLYEMSFIRSAYFPCSAISLNYLFSYC